MDARVRLRPWLERRLNEGCIDGLRWIDREKGIFRIPWKHHSKHSWTQGDAAIFKVCWYYFLAFSKDWAVVTGRYRSGQDLPDWPMWKTRLRCALHKAPDIHELRLRHNLHSDDPYKVYRFVSKTESLWRANATRNASMIFDGIPPTQKPWFAPIPAHSSYRGEGVGGVAHLTLRGSRRPTVLMQRLSTSNIYRPITLVSVVC